MSSALLKEIFSDSLKDTISIFLFVFLFHFIFSFFESKTAHFLASKKKSAPFFGSALGLVPQCGVGVLGADLFSRGLISDGTLIAVFLSCSDEAFAVLFSFGGAARAVLPLLLLTKFLIGCIVGSLFDLLFSSSFFNIPQNSEFKETDSETKFSKHFIHPLIHTLKLSFQILVINFLLAFLIELAGETVFENLLSNAKFFKPFFSSIIGLIPNCSASVLLSKLFEKNIISFGCLLAGLLVNSGLGMIILLKKKETLKKSIRIIAVCFCVSIVSGYITCFISGKF